jgi:hypothetical protein
VAERERREEARARGAIGEQRDQPVDDRSGRDRAGRAARRALAEDLRRLRAHLGVALLQQRPQRLDRGAARLAPAPRDLPEPPDRVEPRERLAREAGHRPQRRHVAARREAELRLEPDALVGVAEPLHERRGVVLVELLPQEVARLFTIGCARAAGS